LEMNTRLQVEHPVTEMITGVDLVEWQVRVAAGQRLPLEQSDIAFTGHAIEARVYAEDPQRGFIPTGGEVLAWEPATHARVDSGIDTGSVIGSAYDPMLAKVITHGSDRSTAITSLRDALARTVLLGVGSNLDYLRFLLDLPEVQAGDIDTGLIERMDVPDRPPADPDVLTAAALAVRPRGEGTGFAALDGWRISGAVPWTVDVEVLGTGEVHQVMAYEEPSEDRNVTVSHAGADVWVHTPVAGTRHLRVTLPIQRRIRGANHGGLTGSWVALSPMPGSVVDIPVEVGAIVGAGDPVVVVEAMKMEHTLRAPAAGVVTAIRTVRGAQVRLDAELIDLELSEGQGT